MKLQALIGAGVSAFFGLLFCLIKQPEVALVFLGVAVVCWVVYYFPRGPGNGPPVLRYA